MSKESHQDTTIDYKGYTAILKWDKKYNTFAGEVTDIDDKLYFWGQTIPEARKALEEVVDAYLEHCEEKGKEPCQPAPPPADCKGYTTTAE